MDVNKAIRMAVDTGKVKFGSRDTLKSATNGTSKIVILSKNCPRGLREDIEKGARLSETYVHQFSGTSLELGSLCGKPFPISAITVFEPGNSNLLDLTKKEEG